MNSRSNSMRWLILAFVAAALAAASAQAGAGRRQTVGDRSDAVSRYLRSHTIRVSRAGLLGPNSAGVTPDAFERYASAHPYGGGLKPTSVTV